MSKSIEKDVLVGKFGFVLHNEGVESGVPERELIELCKSWITDNAKRKSVSKAECISSYALKHMIEDEAGRYIPNGACVQAGVELGFDYWRHDESPRNAQFYLALRARQSAMDKPGGFSRWLFERGDLYFKGDAAIDPTWPRRAMRFIDFWRYVEQYGENAREELCRAWKDYSSDDVPRPDLIDPEIVYERGCDFLRYGEPYPKPPPGNEISLRFG
ncbi:MAG: hypothetical protein ABL959_07425 [Pyrinomonadaceae bacterium]